MYSSNIFLYLNEKPPYLYLLNSIFFDIDMALYIIDIGKFNVNR